MKTARFSAVVEAAGRPKTHLVLVPPEQDKALQAAIKSDRVMTLHQKPTGNKADYGTVGFELGVGCQYLIFPKNLTKFQGMRIIAVTWELLEEGVSKKEAKPPKPRQSAGPGRRRFKEDSISPKPPLEKVVHFAKPEPAREPDNESEAIRQIKDQVRRAMDILEQGKPVAAFNLLKRIVDL
jgi:hypothetical protein